MSKDKPSLLVRTGPFLTAVLTTPRVMLEVILALVPALLAAIWFFGLGSLLVVLAAIAGCVVTEVGFTKGKPKSRTLHDGSAILTGLLLGLTLPPALPMWMAFLGGVVAIGLGKVIWGGLGHNVFNPALVGRAFLQAAFAKAMTATWPVPVGSFDSLRKVFPSNFAPPFMKADVDFYTTATPLNQMKFDGEPTELGSLLFGNSTGSLGETCAIFILVGGLYLMVRRIFDWRIPVSILGSVFVFAGILWLVDPLKHADPLAALMSGGLMLGAFFMATDPVTSPVTPIGTWIFGIGIGVLVVLIRVFGGLPEGVMFAILVMNSAVPLLNRATQPRVFGREGKSKS